MAAEGGADRELAVARALDQVPHRLVDDGVGRARGIRHARRPHGDRRVARVDAWASSGTAATILVSHAGVVQRQNISFPS